MFYLLFTERYIENTYTFVDMNDLNGILNLLPQDQSQSVTTHNNSNKINENFAHLLTAILASNLPLTSNQGSNNSTLSSSILLNILSQISPNNLLSNQNLGYFENISSPSGKPVEGILTQEYHEGHDGLDFGIPVGTPINATMSGNVIYAGWNNEGYGNLVIVENGAYKTYYAHLSEIPVSVGDIVDRGEIVGLSGNTGNSTGPHLHYEVRYLNNPIDPTEFTL